MVKGGGGRDFKMLFSDESRPSRRFSEVSKKSLDKRENL
jgi:hypothetical protein